MSVRIWSIAFDRRGLVPRSKRYVEWLARQGYAARTVLRRTPLLMEFGEFARQRGVTTLEELPSQVEAFALHWLEKHGQGCKTDQAVPAKVKEEARNPVDQMLALVIPGFQDQGRSRAGEPFKNAAPGFFDYLRKERGLSQRSVVLYKATLRALEKYVAIGFARTAGPFAGDFEWFCDREKQRLEQDQYQEPVWHVAGISSLSPPGTHCRPKIRVRLWMHRGSIASPAYRVRLAGMQYAGCWKGSTAARQGANAIMLSCSLLVTYGLRGREIAVVDRG